MHTYTFCCHPLSFHASLIIWNTITYIAFNFCTITILWLYTGEITVQLKDFKYDSYTAYNALTAHISKVSVSLYFLIWILHNVCKMLTCAPVKDDLRNNLYFNVNVILFYFKLLYIGSIHIGLHNRTQINSKVGIKVIST